MLKHHDRIVLLIGQSVRTLKCGTMVPLALGLQVLRVES